MKKRVPTGWKEFFRTGKFHKYIDVPDEEEPKDFVIEELEREKIIELIHTIV